MKYFSASVLVGLTHGGLDEVSSLLQHKATLVKAEAWTEDQLGVAISHATSNLPRATDATDAEVDEMVQAFSQDLTKTSTALMQASLSQKDALLRRASQSAEVSSFFEGYANLPQETKYKVANSALGSEDLINVFETMPEQDRRALLVQLDGNHMDQTLGAKTRTQTRQVEDVAGNKRTETVTTRDGKLVHRHRHVYNARTGQTETVTQSKHHRHRHAHNAKNGGTVTETASAGGHSHQHINAGGTSATVSTGANGYRHIHGHSHRHQNGVTITASTSATKTSSSADEVGHSHSYRHQPGSGTVTNTESSRGNWVHRHRHTHDERTGRTNTDTKR